VKQELPKMKPMVCRQESVVRCKRVRSHRIGHVVCVQLMALETTLPIFFPFMCEEITQFLLMPLSESPCCLSRGSLLQLSSSSYVYESTQTVLPA